LALKIGRPVKWVETRTENLTSTGARDYHMDVEIGATADGQVTALHVATTADHGASMRRRIPASIRQASSALSPAAIPSRSPTPKSTHFTNKAPGGIGAAARSASRGDYAIERGMDIWPTSSAWMPELRKKNFIQDQFPYPSALGFTYDSGDYHKTLDVVERRLPRY
jgi:carbon-monoxide dehydrogenase large subunit